MAAVVGGLRSDTLVSLSDDRIPLLADDKLEEAGELEGDFDTEYALRKASDGACSANPAVFPVRRKRYSGNELIVAVFVVAFDTKKGNVVEWCYPPEVNTEGVEFKSLASGLHHITKDVIYFKHNQLFGLSCYQKIPVASQEERGARMKCVGLLAVGYLDLHSHMEFLQRQVRTQVEVPGEYGSLEEYFRHYRSPRQPLMRPINDDMSSSTFVEVPSIAMTHPPAVFSSFLEFFGPSIFTLWKLAMLKKRIIFFSPPPVEEICYRVYCTCMLTDHAYREDIDSDCNPQFYVNVTDIKQLSTTGNYIACTTERIFRDKTSLFDVFVNGRDITSSMALLEPLLTVTAADRARFDLLSNLRSERVQPSSRGHDRDDEMGFVDFFKELNSQLFRTMHDAGSSEDHVMTTEMIDSLGLDPVRDRFFITELASLHRFNLNVQRGSEMMDLFLCCY